MWMRAAPSSLGAPTCSCREGRRRWRCFCRAVTSIHQFLVDRMGPPTRGDKHTHSSGKQWRPQAPTSPKETQRWFYPRFEGAYMSYAVAGRRKLYTFGWINRSFFWKIVSSATSHSEQSIFPWKSADVNTHLLDNRCDVVSIYFFPPPHCYLTFQIYWVTRTFMGHEIVWLSITNESDFSATQRGNWFIHLARIGLSHFHLFLPSIKSSMWSTCPFLHPSLLSIINNGVGE